MTILWSFGTLSGLATVPVWQHIRDLIAGSIRFFVPFEIEALCEETRLHHHKTYTSLVVHEKKENAMARKCSLTNKKPLVGNRVSHAKNRTKMRQLPNLQSKRIFLPEENRWVRVRLSTRALRTVSKKGLTQFLRDEGLRLKDVVK